MTNAEIGISLSLISILINLVSFAVDYRVVCKHELGEGLAKIIKIISRIAIAFAIFVFGVIVCLSV